MVTYSQQIETALRTVMSNAAALIIEELDKDITSRDDVLEKHAALLREAVRNLDIVQRTLDTVDREIADAETEAYCLREKSHLGTTAEKVNAGILYDKYIEIIEELERKATEYRAELNDCQSEVSRHSKSLDREQRYIAFLREGMLTVKDGDFSHLAVQGTQAYKGSRLPYIFAEVIMSGNRDNPEWQSCQQFLGALLFSSGLRDKDFELPDTGKIELGYLPDNPEAATQPSGTEVLELDRMQREALIDSRLTRYPEYTSDRIPNRYLRDAEIPREALRWKE